MLTITQVLDKLKQQQATNLTAEIGSALAELKQIGQNLFINQKLYGNAGLCRDMLRQHRVAELLTPEVLTYLFTQQPSPETTISYFNFNTNLRTQISIIDVIYYGFMDGLDVIKLMPHNHVNDPSYGEKKYNSQKESFSNTLRIVENIGRAANIADIEKETPIDISVLKQKFQNIVTTIHSINKNNASSWEFHFAPLSKSAKIEQVESGFAWAANHLKLNLQDETLDSLSDKFLRSSEIMLNSLIMHKFLDPVGILAAIQHDTRTQIGSYQFTFEQIFSAIVDKLVSNPSNYPECALEQFWLRFLAVENDLKQHFSTYFEHAVSQPKPYVLKDKGGRHNFVDSIEETAESYIFKGRNARGEERFITIYKSTGIAVGFGGMKMALGLVESGMSSQRANIFEHFQIQVPENLRQHKTLDLGLIHISYLTKELPSPPSQKPLDSIVNNNSSTNQILENDNTRPPQKEQIQTTKATSNQIAQRDSPNPLLAVLDSLTLAAQGQNELVTTTEAKTAASNLFNQLEPITKGYIDNIRSNPNNRQKLNDDYLREVNIHIKDAKAACPDDQWSNFCYNIGIMILNAIKWLGSCFYTPRFFEYKISPTDNYFNGIGKSIKDGLVNPRP